MTTEPPPSISHYVQPRPCNPHPEAPHGFDRDGSHTADRYVCDCEGWIPPAHIIVWPFDDAPQSYRDLSPHGGDEDWLAFVPTALVDAWIGWMEEGTAFGCAGVTQHEVEGGVIRIGAHA